MVRYRFDSYKILSFHAFRWAPVAVVECDRLVILLHVLTWGYSSQEFYHNPLYYFWDKGEYLMVK